MLVAKSRNHHAKPLPVSKRAASIAIALPRTLPSLVFYYWQKAPIIKTFNCPAAQQKDAGLSLPKKA
jgi:hypothetical protein